MCKIMRKTKMLGFVCVAMIFAAPAMAQNIYTVAGGGPNNVPAVSANLDGPVVVGVDASGNLYIATLFTVFRVDKGSGLLTLFAGGGHSSADGIPATSSDLCAEGAAGGIGMAVDSAGNLFIPDGCNNRIRRVNAATQVITTVAGNGTFGSSGDGGPATSAQLSPEGPIAIDSTGNLFFADEGGGTRRIRRVDATTQVITTVASVGVSGMATDSSGNLFFTDATREFVYRMDAGTGAITTVAGNGYQNPANSFVGGYSGDGGPATSAALNHPIGIAVDGAGDLFIADSLNNRIRRVDAATQVISTVAGSCTTNCTGGGDGGPATSADLSEPVGVAVDNAGNLFIADSGNDRIRRVDAATQVITTAAGNGSCCYSADGLPATSADGASGSIALDTAGNLFIGVGNHVRRVDAGTQVITTVAGSDHPQSLGDGGPATSAYLNLVADVGLDSGGNLFIVDDDQHLVRRVDAGTQVITTVAGNPNCFQCAGFSGDGGPATSALLAYPDGVTVDSTGTLFISDGNNERVRRVDAATQVINTYAGNGYQSYCCGGGYGGDGGPATSAELNSPYGLAVDQAGNLFIADANNHRIRRVDAVTNVITTVAGNGYRDPSNPYGSTGGFGGDGGPATSAELNEPIGVALDSTGNLLIADYGNNRIRRVDATTGVITTVAGSGPACFGCGGFSGDGGPATSAELAGPFWVAVDTKGNLFIGDIGNHRIREVVMSSQGSQPQDQTITLATIANRTFAPGDAFAVTTTASSGLPVTLTVGGGSCAISGTTVQITGAGTCTVTAHQGGNNIFNPATDVSQTFSIAKATATVSLGNLTATYNGKPQSVVVSTAPGGLAVAVTYNGAAAAPTSAGSYAVVATVNDANYQGTSSATLTIRPAPLTVTANNMATILNGAIPGFTASYGGFVNGEDVSVLSGALNCTTTAGASGAVGSYPISCGGQGSANYAVSYMPGTLHVLYAPAGQRCYGGAGHTILPPINANGTSVWSQGRTVPAQFRVCDANGNSVRTPGVVASFYLIEVISGMGSASMNKAVSGQFQWDPVDQEWVFNIYTKSFAAGDTYVYRILLNDGTAMVFQFGLT
jgi:sugar lactone lactonase YvrE